MTILALGDSFVDRMDRDSPWCDLLDEDVENHGMAGTSVSYSYNKFLEHYEPKKYSRVIFVMTNTHRQLYSKIDNDSNKHMAFHVNSKRSIEVNRSMNKYVTKEFIDIDTEFTKSDINILKGQELINAMYPNTYDWTERAISDSLKFTTKEPLLILNFKQMMAIQKLDYENLNMEWNPWIEGKSRPNHMSITQSRQFSEYVKKFFNEGFDIYKIFEKTDKYFTISKTKHEAGFTK